MTKADIVQAVYTKLGGFSKKEAADLVDQVDMPADGDHVARFEREGVGWDDAGAGQQDGAAGERLRPEQVVDEFRESPLMVLANVSGRHEPTANCVMLRLDEMKKEAPKPGFRMTGDYSTATGFRLIFQPDQVTMICHAVPAKRLYSVEITETQALVKIQNEAKQVVLSLLANGKLSGSGPIHVVGQVPAGTRTEETFGPTTQSTTRTRQLAPGEQRYYPNATKNGPVWTVQEDTTELVYGSTGSRTVTDFVTKEADCNLGFMNPDGPTPLPPDAENPMGLMMTIFSGAGTLMKGGSKEDALKTMLNLDNPTPPGLRMGGTYAGTSGFSLAFHPESVTMSCGDAHRALEYSIRRTATQTTLQIHDKTNPVSLLVKPDGSLFGQGTVQVNGRVIVGTTESEDPDKMFIYAPRVERCEVGRLVGGASVTGGPISSTGEATAPSSGITVIPSSGPPSLVIKSGFPNQPPDPNPLAGLPVVILKESLESILARAGFGQNGSPGSALTAYARACETRAPLCQQAIQQVTPYVLASARLDPDGGTTGASRRSSGRSTPSSAPG